MDNFDKKDENTSTDFITVGAPYTRESSDPDNGVTSGTWRSEKKETEEENRTETSYAYGNSSGSSYHNSSSDNGFSGGSGAAVAARPKEKYITKKVFVITLICAMLGTSLLTALVLNITGGSGAGGAREISATNYTLAKSTGSELSVQEVIAKNENAVVEIQTESIAHDSWLSNYVTTGAGSGVIVDTDGYILTCNHVVEGSNKVVVRLKNGKEYEASIVGTDPQNDVAVIKIKAEKLVAASYGDSSAISVGDMVVALGNPLGKLGGSASTGIISALDRELNIEGQSMKLLQTDTSINPGNSGGGLFDNHGNLIGIVVAKSTGSDVEGLGFAIPINHAAEIAKDLIEHGHVTNRAAIGVSLLDASDASVAMQYGLRITGLYVQEVTSKEAKDAGLKAGDMFYYFDDKQIETFTDLQGCLKEHKPGDKVKTIVIREGKTVELELTMVESAQ